VRKDHPHQDRRPGSDDASRAVGEGLVTCGQDSGSRMLRVMAAD
jgi:hypothetical protein